MNQDINIGQITEALNNKADRDLININSTGKIVIARNAMPSRQYTELTWGATGATYTAPADGYFSVYRASDVNGCTVFLRNPSNGMNVSGSTTYNGASIGGILPVLVGETVELHWSGGATLSSIIFVYAQGSESEAQ